MTSTARVAAQSKPADALRCPSWLCAGDPESTAWSLHGHQKQPAANTICLAQKIHVKLNVSQCRFVSQFSRDLNYQPEAARSGSTRAIPPGLCKPLSETQTCKKETQRLQVRPCTSELICSLHLTRQSPFPTGACSFSSKHQFSFSPCLRRLDERKACFSVEICFEPHIVLWRKKVTPEWNDVTRQETRKIWSETFFR